MTAPTSRKQPTPHIVLPQGAPALNPGAAAELLEILLEAHAELQGSRTDAA